MTPEGDSSCFGYCRDCERVHSLPEAGAREQARALMQEFERLRRLDYLAPCHATDPLLGFDHLFPGGHGNMFGVLECRDAAGETVVLRAFSSLRRGIRDVDGWVQPLLPADLYYGTILPTQEKIEALTARLAELERDGSQARELLRERKRISRGLLQEMNSQYRLHNFRGDERALDDAFVSQRGRPGGVGECCAPKLLDHAATHGLRPISMVEFYWGDSKTLEAGEFYPCCETRCQPILGFMLCGLDADV